MYRDICQRCKGKAAKLSSEGPAIVLLAASICAKIYADRRAMLRLWTQLGDKVIDVLFLAFVSRCEFSILYRIIL